MRWPCSRWRHVAAVARLLATCLRSGDILARHGGDEFIAIITDVTASTVEPLHARIREGTQAFSLDTGKPWHIEFSFGIALSDSVNPPSLIDPCPILVTEKTRPGCGKPQSGLDHAEIPMGFRSAPA